MSELLAELQNIKEQTSFIKSTNIEIAAKAYGLKTFQYTRQLNEDAMMRKIRLLGR